MTFGLHVTEGVVMNTLVKKDWITQLTVLSTQGRHKCNTYFLLTKYRKE